MKAKFLALSAGAALLAATSTPGLAGGDYAGVKEYSAGVPVPAPIPVPMYHPLWYFRFDVGMGFGDNVEATESGMSFGEGFTDPGGGIGYGAASPISSDSSWIDGNYTNDAVWNLGLGYYWTRKFRTDITMESRRTIEVNVVGSDSSTLVANDGVPRDPLQDFYNVSVKDHTLVRGAVFMVNGYYEFGEWGPLKPYLGAGIGFGYTDVERKHESSASAVDVTGTGAATPVAMGTNYLRDRQQVTSTAFSATFGMTYDLSEITQVDIGYRFLWVEGAHAELSKIGSRVEIDDVTEHQIRAGLRFNVY